MSQHDRGINSLYPIDNFNQYSLSDDDSGCILEEYSWWPNHLKPNMVHLYFRCLPEDKVPYVGGAGDKWRNRQLRQQLPAQDSDARYCSSLSAEEVRELRNFDSRRKMECFGVGVVKKIPYDDIERKCHTCSNILDEGSIAVFSDRLGSYFHPSCFNCYECRTLLVDLMHFSHQNQIYCGRHHAEQHKPRCARCDELIFGEECTEAEGKTWHLNHFQCNGCGQILGGKKYMQRNGRPECLSCFHSSTSQLSCVSCKKNIKIENPHITQGDLHWHADSRCFSCYKCSKILIETPYSLVNGKLFCQNSCITKDFPEVSVSARVTDRKNGHQRHMTLWNTFTEETPSITALNIATNPVNQAIEYFDRPQPPTITIPALPTENIYETVQPSTSHEFEKKDGELEDGVSSINLYSRTPIKMKPYDQTEQCYSCSSSDSEDDDYYINNLMQNTSLSRTNSSNKKTPQMSVMKIAKKKKSNRCLVS